MEEILQENIQVRVKKNQDIFKHDFKSNHKKFNDLARKNKKYKKIYDDRVNLNFFEKLEEQNKKNLWEELTNQCPIGNCLGHIKEKTGYCSNCSFFFGLENLQCNLNYGWKCRKDHEKNCSDKLQLENKNFLRCLTCEFSLSFSFF